MIRFKRLAKSFKYAFKGFKKVFFEEQNFRIQIIIALFVVALGFYFRIKSFEWIILAFVIGLVMILEMVNSAVERTADILKPRIHSYTKEVKDIMAAAVMLASVISVIIGVIIFFPYVFK